ncbi:hypothetical protein [Telluribacter sp. SYSU D00476]|uniref:hypothetical protein n=1 Tax=Telluribacter sp. SYSU D00476 TaxID=2811430 RepID=UPI001FF2743C|nr:hypothetical protein [Telluribacter sp. SYSU D00476]
MKKIFKAVVITMVGAFLWNCQNTNLDVNTDQSDLTATKGARTATTTPNACETITFEGLAHGTRISTVTTTSGVVGVLGYNPKFPTVNAATIFDSNKKTVEDPDLQTPGYGPGNTTKLNNILIVQENPNSSTPDDAALANTRLELNFSTFGGVNIYSMNLIDVEGGEVGANVKFYDAANMQIGATVALPSTGDNGVKLITFTGAIGVTKMVVTLNGSGAIDNIGFCVTKYNPKQCTYTQGYWKNHTSVWPVKGLYLGSNYYTNADLIKILNTSVAGNGLISLAHQLIAAKLNIANGANPTAITKCMSDADKLIGSKNILKDKVSPSTTSSLVETLTKYNEGKIGPGHCK